jgi:predicted dehydrogenase
MEKPVAVDPTGVRMVIEAGRIARDKKLSVVAGTQRRHELAYNEAFMRVRDGAIGTVHSAAVYWNQGGLWMNPRLPGWTDVEWQLRNWLYFAWLSGDHIVEQHVHNLDVAHWFMGDVPSRVSAQGGRQVRTSPEYGHVFDHFACDFEYEDGRRISSYCRQIDGCSTRCEEVIHGTEGRVVLSQFGHAEIFGRNPWKWRGEQTNPYEQEHKDLIASITGTGPYLNHAERIARSTMMAIMGRTSAYSGKAITWDQAMDSKLCLMPSTLALGPLPSPDVAVPGKTPSL